MLYINVVSLRFPVRDYREQLTLFILYSSETKSVISFEGSEMLHVRIKKSQLTCNHKYVVLANLFLL